MTLEKIVKIMEAEAVEDSWQVKVEGALLTVSGRTRSASPDAAIGFRHAQNLLGRIEEELGDYTAEVFKDISAIAPNTSGNIGDFQGEMKVIYERS